MHFHCQVFVILICFVSSSLLCILLGPPFTRPAMKETNLPVHSTFEFPFPLPTWPPGGGFARGYIDLGGLHVYQVTTFKKIWAVYQGGPKDLGATFYEPSEIPDGFFMLGSYSQPNDQPLFGSLFVGKVVANTIGRPETLKSPIDYTLVWSTELSKIRQSGPGYIWYPIPPDGYEAAGYVVTSASEKPSLDKIRCVRSDFTHDCDIEKWIWGESSSISADGFSAYSLRPSARGTLDQGVPVGSFIFMKNWDADALTSVSCLKNNNFSLFSIESMPNLRQIHALFQTYSLLIYFHPQETYLPSSVNWFFSNGALLYTKGQESTPSPIKFQGENLPRGGLDDGRYWLDLPADETSKEKLKKGNFPSSEAYLHVKSMFGGTYSDIVIWIFCPFNGPGMLKFGPIDISLSKLGEHVGDWEHMTLRISNFNGMLQKVFFSQHSSGTWIDASFLEFQNGSNKFVAYSSLHGHAFYSKPGLDLQGAAGFGIRNDMAKSNLILDTGGRYVIVSADYLSPPIVKPPWLYYAREWGPRVTYNLGLLVKFVENILIGVYKSIFQSLVNLFPNELFGEEGPIGPKMKRNWKKDEL
ncbi:hypothetical protein At1g04090-like [Coffea arabica]|uniref:Vacuolar protein sorting-associated protein 62-like n=1 Tax=Coffea arabica TaxID=13443 RepID=A0A6P6TYE1_COFAR